jgi:hypothetical protein
MLASDLAAVFAMLDRSASDISQSLHLHHRTTQGTLESCDACFDRLLTLSRDSDATGQEWRRMIA